MCFSLLYKRSAFSALFRIKTQNRNKLEVKHDLRSTFPSSDFLCETKLRSFFLRFIAKMQSYLMFYGSNSKK